MTESLSAFYELSGTFYQTILERLHAILQPQSYFEIGTLNGETLKLASCSSVSVDPQYQISSDVLGSKPSCQFFQITSDRFFAKHNLRALLNGPVEFAFLDGMHLFEFLLRDFINTERTCQRSSVIVLHDCVPGDAFITVRSPADPRRLNSVHPGYWTGDVWKIIPALRRWRPDLRMLVLDAPPTGLVLLTNLDPSSTILDQNYQTVLDEFLGLDLGEYGVDRLIQECDLVSTDALTDLVDLAPAFLRPTQQRGGAHKAGGGGKEQFTYTSPLATGLSEAIQVWKRGAQRSLSRPGPAFHDDPDKARLFTETGTVTIPHAPPFTVRGKDLRLVGYRSYLTPDGRMFTDEALVSTTEEDTFLARLCQDEAFPNEDTGLVPTGRRGEFYLQPRGREAEHLSGQVLSLCSFEPTNYGAFLFRVLPKLAGQEVSATTRVLAPLYNQSMRDLFELSGVTLEQIIPHDTQVIYQFDDVIIPSLRCTHALLDEETLKFYSRLRERFGVPPSDRKIFVSRAGWSGSEAATQRVMTNEDEVAHGLASLGFEMIQPHAMSIKNQIEAFSSAAVIVGASGSAMFNVVFSHPGTRLVAIESEPHWGFSHMNLFGSVGLDYGILEAMAEDQDWSVPHKRFKVNVEALLARLAAF